MISSYSFPSLLILLLEYPFEEKVFTFHSFARQLSKKTGRFVRVRAAPGRLS